MPPPKVCVPKLKGFRVQINAKELENFLWDMEQYFKAAHVSNSEKVSITSMSLFSDAKLWWHARMGDDTESGRPQIVTLKKELKDQFMPSNATWLARESLKQLRQTRSVRKYVKDFSSLLLDIRSMSNEDNLFNFI